MKINRNIIKRLEAELSEPKISILLGARQVGKTTLLHDIEEIAQKDGKKTAFYDLESSADLMKLSGDNNLSSIRSCQAAMSFLSTNSII